MTQRNDSPGDDRADLNPRRWWALAAIALAQMMIVVDGTIMNIALPAVQTGLEMSDTGRQWVITAYALAFGGLLLLGGRLSELIGRRRSLLIGLAGFAGASALGGLAQSPEMLLAARALQGAFGALQVPSALALLAASFPASNERGRAFGLYATVIGSGTGIGVLLGGILTEYADWRWCMLVNVPVAIAAAAGIRFAVGPVPPSRNVRLDVPGALLATTGLVSLVYGFSRAEEDGWRATITLASLGLGVVLLVAFTWLQTRVAAPLLPLRVVLNRRRSAAYLSALGWGIGVISAFYFLTFILQNVLDYSPVRTGLAYLPFTLAIMAGARVMSRIVMRTPLRSMLPAGLLAIAAALVLLTRIETGSSYLTTVFPIFLLLGLGTSLILVPGNSTATLNTGADTGVAGAMVQTSQQVGASLGIAVLGTVAGSATSGFVQDHAASADLAARATLHGFATAGLVGAAILVAFAGVVAVVTGPATARGEVPVTPVVPVLPEAGETAPPASAAGE